MLTPFNIPGSNAFFDDRFFWDFDNLLDNLDMKRRRDNLRGESRPGAIQTNIVKHKDGSNESYTLQFSLPGYAKEDLRVEQQDRVLVIRTSDEFDNIQEGVSVNGKPGEWVHHGIPHSSFEIRRTLEKNAEVTDISLKNGILSVSFSLKEEKKPVLGFEIN